MKLLVLAAFWWHLGGVAAWRGANLRARRVSGFDKSVGHLDGSGAGASDGAGKHADKASLEETLGSMVVQFMQGKGPTLHDVVNTARGKMDLSDAVKRLDGKLPADVASLVRLTGASDAEKKGKLDEDSLQKARGILNNMVFEAWGELDNVIFEYKEFEEMNRGTYEQVMTDISNLGSDLAGLGGERTEATEGISKDDDNRKETEGILSNENEQYAKEEFEDSTELTIRKNDLVVFDFILQLTACKEPAFLQFDGRAADPGPQICNTSSGLELHFEDRRLQSKMERMMTPEARQALQRALGQIQGKVEFLQQDPPPEAGAPSPATTTGMPSVPPAVAPVKEEPAEGGQWKKCVNAKPNCGLLHDLMSLEWGKFKDSVDELAAEMEEEKQHHQETEKNLNTELGVINENKRKDNEHLAMAVASINTDTEESNEKTDLKHGLQTDYDEKVAKFKATISEILFTKMCAVRKVRDEVLTASSKSPPNKVKDCDVSDWVPKDGQCINPKGETITCDDACPDPNDPYKCGGKEMMKRDEVVAPNEFGIKCPALERQKKCAQRKCERNCQMSAWSGWSKCTKDCESGVQVKSRSVVSKPKNGGQKCDAVQESRPCHTGSCDRDCKLSQWSDWTPCTMACDGGLTERRKSVTLPIRGLGKCPKTDAPDRLEENPCNTQKCVGDEVCVAQQDLIIAIDGSGSLKEEGFKILKNFAVEFTQRYQSMAYGITTIRMGVLIFGQGRLISNPDGTTTIAPAENVQALTDDLDAVREAIGKLEWQRGFTNMAQAFALADTMFNTGRASAQSAILMLSDGKYSFRFQTAEKATELKDKGVQIFMAPVTPNEGGKELEDIKAWASPPWETNYEHIPGLEALEYNMKSFASRLLVKFCPDSFSPTLVAQQEDIKGYMLVHEQGWPDEKCAESWQEEKQDRAAGCAEAARKKGVVAFAYSDRGIRTSGDCYTQKIDYKPEDWEAFQANRKDTPCPGGGWEGNPFFDTFFVNPKTMPGQEV
mmetsp:Transcript_26061/g.82395  ORF Transcript_26061/g.82395 Transcript_26061/m.82395 type:complete len:1002 (-) Transcript_26061:73-3078(-)